MKELSLHILDIVENSIKAKASLITVSYFDTVKDDKISIIIEDNGCGIKNNEINNVTNPFYTTRKTRSVGLGLSLLKEACERCNGNFSITSQLNKGTKVIASFQRSNIDVAPLGNISETILTIVNSLPEYCKFIYRHVTDEKKFEFSTVEIKNIIGDISICSPQILSWIKNHIEESIHDIYN